MITEFRDNRHSGSIRVLRVLCPCDSHEPNRNFKKSETELPETPGNPIPASDFPNQKRRISTVDWQPVSAG